jgi:two-component system KDP operon response regulator KdpE
MKFLIIDDDADITESVRLGFGLQWREVEVISADNGDDGLRLLEEQAPDLVLLDVGLPSRDGYEILRELRGFTDVPVIMLTARDDVADKVKGLELGADDYITKPFDHLELLARVRAVLRRLDLKAPKSRVPSFRSGPLEIDFDAQEARLAGEHVTLTPTEYRLLEHLARNAGWVVPHATLLARVWGREYSTELDYLRVYVRRLREKLGDDPARPRYIRTERGVGYRFIAPREPG